MESIINEVVKKYSNITEAYEVIKTVEIVKDRDSTQRYRIEVIKYCKTYDYFDVFCWRYLSTSAQSSFPKTEGGKNKESQLKPEEIRILVQVKMPDIIAPTDDIALTRAIDYLSTGDIFKG
jgi:hypothetical protein